MNKKEKIKKIIKLLTETMVLAKSVMRSADNIEDNTHVHMDLLKGRIRDFNEDLECELNMMDGV